MKYKNICKFIEDGSTRELFTKCFVCERTPSAMKNVISLKSHRAVLFAEGGTVYINEEAFDAVKGDMIFLFAGDKFSAEPSEGCEYFYIDFDGFRCEELTRRFGITAADRVRRGHEGLIPFWREALTKASEGSIDLIAESVLLYSFSDLAENVTEEAGAAARAAELIDDEFSDAGLNLAAAAERLGYNSKYLSHSFKQRMGVSFSEYLRTVRIRHAVFLMEHGLESVKNVSYLCGFDDPLYFSAVFKKVIGTPPAAYMKRCRENNT